MLREIKSCVLFISFSVLLVSHLIGVCCPACAEWMVAGIANNAIRGEKNSSWFLDPVKLGVNFGTSEAVTESPSG